MSTEPHVLPPYWGPPPADEELVWDDGEPMESDRHRGTMNLLVESL